MGQDHGLFCKDLAKLAFTSVIVCTNGLHKRPTEPPAVDADRISSVLLTSIFHKVILGLAINKPQDIAALLSRIIKKPVSF